MRDPGARLPVAIRTNPGAVTVRVVPQRVELLYWEGCPSHPEALELLRDVIAARGLDLTVELREVRSDEEAEQLAFPGSPTIRVDGRDVDAAGAAAPPALTCRIYHHDGRVSPVPSRRQLEEALQ
jgi:hypothetical protein